MKQNLFFKEIIVQSILKKRKGDLLFSIYNYYNSEEILKIYIYVLRYFYTINAENISIVIDIRINFNTEALHFLHD